jgi:hypothetical protein
MERVTRMKFARQLAAVLLFCGSLWLADFCRGEDAIAMADASEPAPIAPAKSIRSGLLLEPPLDLAWFTREKFIEETSTVGAERIGKKWTSPVKQLPPPDRVDAHGLTEGEVKDYMFAAKDLFDRGEAIPMSDVGLISTQEDVIRQPMLNHISAFENSAVRVYLLVQKTASDKGWGYFSIVQDMMVDPPVDYYGQILDKRVNLEGTSCYKCHSSGPLAIHPAREDLVLDAKLAAALSAYIAEQPLSEFHFPKHSPKPDTGRPMTVSACTACHEEGGVRSPLYQVHSHPIRILVDFGYMPPDERLTPEETVELQTWLDDKNDVVSPKGNAVSD